MFAFATNLISREIHRGALVIEPISVPVDHVVTKDGRPFAVVNATPELAERTLAGFVRSAPGARWTMSRS